MRMLTAFRGSWLGLSLYGLLLLLLCSLGFWQLQRAEQKAELLKRQALALVADPVDLTRQAQIDVDSLRYHPVTLQGHFDTAHTFLLDNQIVNGRSGYYVLSPFIIAGQNLAVLVNRGWVPLGADRRILPVIDSANLPTHISGRINHFPGVGFKLKGAEIPTDTQPAVVQLIDADVLSQTLTYPLLPYQIELAANLPGGYLRDWQVSVPIPPEKHQAYAVQWFGLALTLTGLFIWINLRKRK